MKNCIKIILVSVLITQSLYAPSTASHEHNKTAYFLEALIIFGAMLSNNFTQYAEQKKQEESSDQELIELQPLEKENTIKKLEKHSKKRRHNKKNKLINTH